MQFHSKHSALQPRVLRACLALASFAVLIWLGVPPAHGQTLSNSQASDPGRTASPALVDAAGPDISLQNSEALFDIAVALNACGYDQGLATSDPVRHEGRELG